MQSRLCSNRHPCRRESRTEMNDQPTTRRWRLTGSGLRILAASGCLMVVGRILGLDEAYAASAALLVIVGHSALRSFLWYPRLTIRRSISPSHVSVDEPCLVRLEVTNDSRRHSPPVQVRDFVEDSGSALAAVAPLAPFDCVSITYSLPTARRGRFALDPCSVSLLDPFRLAERSIIVPGDAEFVVWPRVWPLRLPERDVGLDPGLHRPGSRIAAVTSEEFSTLGEYMPGDDTRHIHWPSSARAGRLMVRHFEPPGPNTTWVLLDRVATHRESFEVAVSMAASILGSAVASGGGFSLSLVAPDGSVSPGSGPTLPSKRSPSTSRNDLDVALNDLASTDAVLEHEYSRAAEGEVGEPHRPHRLLGEVRSLATHVGDRVVLITSSEMSPTTAFANMTPEGIDLLVVIVSADSTVGSMDAFSAQELLDRSVLSRPEARWIPHG